MTTARDVIAFTVGQMNPHLHSQFTFDDADAILAALEAAGISLIQWQSIETAPRERDSFGLTPEIMLYAPAVNASGPVVREGRYRYGDEKRKLGWVSTIDPDVPNPYFEPTHWSPLPAPPKVKP